MKKVTCQIQNPKFGGFYTYVLVTRAGLCAFIVGGVRVILLGEGRRRTLVDTVSRPRSGHLFDTSCPYRVVRLLFLHPKICTDYVLYVIKRK